MFLQSAVELQPSDQAGGGKTKKTVARAAFSV
jgi:hypothetical protein